MNRIKNFLAVSAFSLLVLGLPAVASAQWGGNGGYGNGGYGNNGRYNQNIKGTLQNLKSQARSFESTTNRADDRNDDRWGGGWGNNRGYRGDIGRLENLADDFKKATDKLENKYGNGRNLNNSRDEAQRVLDIANQIDQEIYQTRNRNLQNQWNQMRYSLDTVANVYGYGGYNNRNNRNNRNGNWRNRMPFPLPF